MATSQLPTPRPARNSPAATSGIEPAEVPAPATVKPTATMTAPPITVRATPARLITHPADGRASTEPALIAMRTRPRREGVSSSASCTSGMREAQLAKVTPAMTNAAITARWAVRTCAVGRVTVPVPPVLPPATWSPSSCAGEGAAAASNRFGRNDSLVCSACVPPVKSR